MTTHKTALEIAKEYQAGRKCSEQDKDFLPFYCHISGEDCDTLAAAVIELTATVERLTVELNHRASMNIKYLSERHEEQSAALKEAEDIFKIARGNPKQGADMTHNYTRRIVDWLSKFGSKEG